jgi:hypothetical protein|tara:strand:- start:523 stop:786 length:264 start_codon:yes stop_codon:yes gene_type:complete
MSIPPLFLKYTTKIAKPIAASAAAIVKIKIENIWPSRFLRNIDADTKLIFAAKRIISIHIKMSIIFLRFKNNPKQPIINKITERIKK